MAWWGWAILGIAGFVCFWLYLGSQGVGRNRSRYDLQHAIRSLLILRDNGGYVNVKHRRSRKFLRVYRESGEEADVLLMVRVPTSAEVPPPASPLESVLEKQGLQFTHESSAPAFLAVPVTVPDIWATDAGAVAARVAHLALDSWGLGAEDKVDLRLEGQGSWRAMRRMREGNSV